MPYKLTMFFSLGRRNWSEAYLNTGGPTDTGSGLNNTALVNARAALLGNDAHIYGVRLSNVPANGIVLDLDARSFNSGGQFANNNEGLGIDDSDQPNSSMLVKCGSAIGQKLIYIGGIPDGVIDDSNSPPPGLNFQKVNGFSAAFISYGVELRQGGWGYRTWKTSTRVQALGLQQGTQTPPLIGVQLAAPTGWAVNSQVLLGGWRRKNPYSPGLSGIFRIAGVPLATQAAPPYVYYLSRTEHVDSGNFKSVGTIALSVFTIATFTAVEPDRACTRKRGGRSNLPLGRSSKSR